MYNVSMTLDLDQFVTNDTMLGVIYKLNNLKRNDYN